jgi:hypothetical protein
MILGIAAAVLVVGTLSILAIADNGAPSGGHYNLNIIGVAKDKSENMDQGAGNVIFVPLEGATAIYLTKGDFAVLDKNGTDGRAEFRLPDPGLDPYIVGEKGNADTVADYSVFVRPLGKPGGWSTITTCADLVESTFAALLPDDVVKFIIRNREGLFGGYASIEQVGSEITLRQKGKSTFVNVTAQLLTIVFQVELYDTEGNLIRTVLVRVPIFDDSIENEYWEYDNHGLKILSVRFYPGVTTDVSEADVNLKPLP